MTPDEVRRELREHINSALQRGEADPHALAARTFDLLPDAAVRLLAVDGWRVQIHRAIQKRRAAITADTVDLQRVAVGSVDDMVYRWAHLKDCTVFDLQRIEVSYRDRAAQNTATAEKYARLRAAMVERGAEVVGDLPDDVVAAILEGAADSEPAREGKAA